MSSRRELTSLKGLWRVGVSFILGIDSTGLDRLSGFKTLPNKLLTCFLSVLKLAAVTDFELRNLRQCFDVI
jgi:hypothetical protein